MKKRALRTFTMLSLLSMLTTVSVCAQSERSGVLNIQFNFIVGGKTHCLLANTQSSQIKSAPTTL
jgi:hypothetical protein